VRTGRLAASHTVLTIFRRVRHRCYLPRHIQLTLPSQHCYAQPLPPCSSHGRQLEWIRQFGAQRYVPRRSPQRLAHLYIGLQMVDKFHEWFKEPSSKMLGELSVRIVAVPCTDVVSGLMNSAQNLGGLLVRLPP